MYLYFDVNGNLKEVIQVPVRQGSVEFNKIYAFIAPTVVELDEDTYKKLDTYDSAKINFEALDSGNNLNPNGGSSVDMSEVTKQIPFDKNRDLKYFKYGYNYEFWTVNLPSTVTNTNGVVTASIYLYNTGESDDFALNRFSFNVEASVGVKPDSTMSESQYSYLYNKYHNLEGQFIPYSGATQNINLGSHELTANKVNIGDLTIEQLSEGAYQIGANYQDTLNLGFGEVDINGQKIVVEEDLDDYATTDDLESYATIDALSDYLPLTGGELSGNLSLLESPLLLTEDSANYIAIDKNDDNLYITIANEGDETEYRLENNDDNGTHIIATQDWVGDNYLSLNGGAMTADIDMNGNDITNVQNISFETDGNIGLNESTDLVISSSGHDIILVPDSEAYIGSKSNSNIIATKGDLPQKNAIGTFNTNSFTNTGSNYVLTDIPLSGFIAGSDLLIITWGGCFAICPIPVSGPGRVAAALWNSNGESQVVRIKYELKSNNTLLDISLAGGFTPPSNFTGYVINYKIA